MIGNRIVRIETIPSTNNYVAKEILAGTYASGDVILAHFQTEGRGQRGSVWQSLPGKNLTFSFALPTDFLPLHWQFVLSKGVSVALHRYLLEVLGSEVYIKWPNDLLVSDKKIAGILLESIKAEGIKHTIIGIGLNVNQEIFPEGIKATSLALELGRPVVESILLDRLLQSLNKWLTPIFKSAFDEVHKNYLENLYGRSQWIHFEDNERIFEGQIKDVDHEGVMLVKSRQGHALNYRSKEVKIIY